MEKSDGDGLREGKGEGRERGRTHTARRCRPAVVHDDGGGVAGGGAVGGGVGGGGGGGGSGGEIYTGCQPPNNVIALYKLRECAASTVERIKAAAGRAIEAAARARV